MVSLPF